MRRILLALAIALSAPPARGEGQTVALIVQNDVLHGTDRYFTSGLQLSYTSPPVAGPLHRAAEDVVGEPLAMRLGLSIGQSIYTPSDLRSEDPGRRDRPYAGVLVASGAVHLEHGASLTTVVLSAGVRGPAAGGAVVQRAFHAVIGATEPRGWGRQLGNEAVGQLLVEHGRRFATAGRSGLELDLTPTLRAGAGNLDSYAGLGVVVRAGTGLESDVGPPRLRPVGTTGGYFERLGGTNAYAFAGAEVRATLHDATLGGQEPRILGGDVSAGAAVQALDLQASVTLTHRFAEFEGQERGHWFATLALQRAY